MCTVKRDNAIPVPLRVLIVEDSENDALLLLKLLAQGGYEVAHERVQSAEAMRAALDSGSWDIVFSDFGMPGFDGRAALALLRERDPDMPFILVSGSIGENTAVEMMKAGASNYVMKGNSARLVPAVRRELLDAGLRHERKRAREALRESEARFRSLTALSSDWYWEQDDQYRFISQGVDSENKQNIPAGTTAGSVRWENPTTNLTVEQWAAHRAVLDARQLFKDFEYSRLGTGDDRRWVSVSGGPIFGADGIFKGYRGVGKDITERKVAEIGITRLNRVYAVLSGINSLIVRVGSRDELFRGACRIAVEDGKFPKVWIGLVDPEAKHVTLVASAGTEVAFFEKLVAEVNMHVLRRRGIVWKTISERRPEVSNDISQDPRVLRQDEASSTGTRSLAALPLMLAGEVTGVLVLNAGEIGFFDAEEMKLLTELAGNISFAIEHIVNSERLAYLASYDALTGLANRALFQERVGQHLAEARDSGRAFALKLMNIDRFKMVNDTLGREAGDELLRQIAARMVGVTTDPARLARITGDLFGMMALDPKSAEDLARLVVRRNEQVFGAPFTINGSELRISGRTGIAVYPEDGGDAETLFKHAEAALKSAKSKGEPFLFFAQEMSSRVAEKLALEQKLRQALQRDEFVLHYQPKVELRTRTIVGVEALIRWQSPGQGLVPPLKFIPLLEETGLILEVGAWALGRAALDHRGWVESGLRAPRIAVNVSSVQLRRPEFGASLEEAIAKGATPHGLDLEITESLIMQDIEGSIDKLKAARDLGFGLAIDDFGTGYSSLAYLAKLPVQTLKIDRAFIIRMLDDPNDMMLVQTMISLAHSLRLKVVAEGVEEEEQAKMLHLLRCDEMQGYLFSKPLPLAEVTKLLQASG